MPEQKGQMAAALRAAGYADPEIERLRLRVFSLERAVLLADRYLNGVCSDSEVKQLREDAANAVREAAHRVMEA